MDLTFQTSTKRQKLEDDKVDEGTANVSEPMDTSEDVAMIDVSDKKVEKNDATEVIESIERECVKEQSSESTISLGQAEESVVVEKDLSNTEQKMAESNPKSEDANEDTGSSENAKCSAKDDVATPTTKDNDKGIVEKTEENLDTIAEITAAVDDSMDVSTSESISKPEITLTSSEKIIEDSTDITKDAQAEGVDKTQAIENDEKADIIPQSQTCDKNIANKSEECLTAKKDEVKEESKVISGTSGSENIVTKKEEEATKMESTAIDIAENGEAVETAVEKTTVPPTETEVTDIRKEATASNDSAEKTLEVTAESEKVDEKVAQEMKAETTNADKRETETTQETIKEEETVKEEKVVDKNAVDSEKQKLNGATQNGNTDVPVLDDKLHSNGLNEGSSKEATNEDAAAQNGEPESLSESSAESIKVKKVVDPAVADGGEPDVVPPVVVAATS